MLDTLKALLTAAIIGAVFVFIVILGYMLVPAIILILVVGISFLIAQDHIQTKKRNARLNQDHEN